VSGKLQAHEGPCLDAFRAGESVEHENLRAGSGRWPSFSTAALKAGFQSAVALPLRLRDATLGALNLLSVRQTPMVEADIIVARAFADLERAGIDLAEAFSRLRRYARNRNLRLTDVAEAAIVGSLDPQAWPRRTVRPPPMA
jgi:GAF domain/ANTAR domain